MDVVSELLLDASNNMDLARERERHEELQAPIISPISDITAERAKGKKKEGGE